MKTAIIYVSGEVQKVGYRTKVMGLANYLSLDGCIRNLPDGKVKIVAQGPENKLKDFTNKLKIKDTYINVQEVEVDYADHYEGFVGFNKIEGDEEIGPRIDKAVIELKGIKTELKEVVTALKETNQSIQNMHKDLKEGNQEFREFRIEFHEFKEDNKASVLEEIHEVKTLIKAHLKIL